MNTPTPIFDHDNLRVYREAILFIAWWEELQLRISLRAVRDQMDRASTSIALNIAEGNGKYAPRDRCRFFDVARGSALECAACLDVLVARGRLSPDDVGPGKQHLHSVVNMLVRLIESVADRVKEERS